MMNRRAEEIGAVDTHFTNTHGLTDPQHYTTAYDIYLILREAMKDPRFREIAGCALMFMAIILAQLDLRPLLGIKKPSP